MHYLRKLQHLMPLSHMHTIRPKLPRERSRAFEELPVNLIP